MHSHSPSFWVASPHTPPRVHFIIKCQILSREREREKKTTRRHLHTEKCKMELQYFFVSENDTN